MTAKYLYYLIMFHVLQEPVFKGKTPLKFVTGMFQHVDKFQLDIHVNNICVTLLFVKWSLVQQGIHQIQNSSGVNWNVYFHICMHHQA
jgi:hypothetical protein